MPPNAMLRATLVLACLVAPAEGFFAPPPLTPRRPFVVVASTTHLKASARANSQAFDAAAAVGDPSHITYDPVAGTSKGVDMARAHACADHFGQCTVEEMQELRDSLHKERLQRFMFATAAGSPPPPPSTSTSPDAGAPAVATLETIRELEDSLEHRLLEEELDLQLSMLRDQNDLLKSGNPNLFPEVEEPMEELPHLKDHTHYDEEKKALEKAELALALEETVLEESNLEAIALCACIGAVLLFPRLLHL